MDRSALHQGIRRKSVGSAFAGYVVGVAASCAVVVLVSEAGAGALLEFLLVSYFWKSTATVAGYSLLAAKDYPR